VQKQSDWNVCLAIVKIFEKHGKAKCTVLTPIDKQKKSYGIGYAMWEREAVDKTWPRRKQ